MNRIGPAIAKIPPIIPRAGFLIAGKIRLPPINAINPAKMVNTVGEISSVPTTLIPKNGLKPALTEMPITVSLIDHHPTNEPISTTVAQIKTKIVFLSHSTNFHNPYLVCNRNV